MSRNDRKNQKTPPRATGETVWLQQEKAGQRMDMRTRPRPITGMAPCGHLVKQSAALDLLSPTTHDDGRLGSKYFFLIFVRIVRGNHHGAIKGP
jgi:hypothetical protein